MNFQKSIARVVLGGALLLISPALLTAAPPDSGVQAKTAPATRPASSVKIIKNVPYVPGGGNSQSLDLYLPHSAKPLPLLLYIHGGGWVAGDKSYCLCKEETAHGYAAASMNYRFSNQAIFPAQIQDCQAAIRFLRANAVKYNIDPDRIGVWGDSAGGHLVALLGVTGGKHAFPPIGGNESQSDKVQAVVDWYGPTDFLTIAQQAPANDVLHANQPDSLVSRLFGGPVADHKELAMSASPVHYVDKNCPPMLIEQGAIDNIVPPAQSQELAAALKKAGAPVTLIMIPKAGHGTGFTNQPHWRQTIDTFFDKALKGAGEKKTEDGKGR